MKNSTSTVSTGSGVQGGLIYINTGAFMLIKNCAFINNKQYVTNTTTTSTTPIATVIASYGTTTSALSRITIVNSTFYGNISNGGVGSIGTNHNLTLINCTFANNKGIVTGGVYINNNIEYNVTNCLFQNNIVSDNTKYGNSIDFATSTGVKLKGKFNGCIWTAGNCGAPTAISPYIISINNNSIFADYLNGIPVLDAITNSIPLKAGTPAVASGVTTFVQYGQSPYTDFGFTLAIPDSDQIGNPRVSTSCSIGSRYYLSLTTITPLNNINNIKIYSNENKIYIDSKEIGSLSIFNCIGQSLLQKSISGNNFVSEILPKGIYLVQFVNIKGEKIVNKIIIK
jgi:hypothetical protein